MHSQAMISSVGGGKSRLPWVDQGADKLCKVTNALPASASHYSVSRLANPGAIFSRDYSPPALSGGGGPPVTSCSEIRLKYRGDTLSMALSYLPLTSDYFFEISTRFWATESVIRVIFQILVTVVLYPSKCRSKSFREHCQPTSLPCFSSHPHATRLS